MGALLVFIGFILFIGKRHFGRAFATIFGKRANNDMERTFTLRLGGMGYDWRDPAAYANL